MDRKQKGCGESRQNLTDHKKLWYTQGDVIYVQYLRVYLTSQNVLSQFPKLNYLKTHTHTQKNNKTKPRVFPLLQCIHEKKKNPFPVN